MEHPALLATNPFEVPIEALTLSLDKTPLRMVHVQGVSPLPDWVTQQAWLSVSYTHTALTLVGAEDMIPPQAITRPDVCWHALKVNNTGAYAWVGILATLSKVIAQAGISIFVLSTFETDYILVKATQSDRACNILRQAGATLLLPIQ
jgi:uncharacterized protein